MISVIIASYNRFNFLQEAIQSVIDQTYKPLEIIIINDGSTDPLYQTDWHKLYGDIVVRIDLEKNSKKIFGSSAPGYVRNEGIKIAKGKYIAILDDDDIWLPWKLEIQMNIMEKHNLDFSSTDGFISKQRWNYDQIKKLFISVDNYPTNFYLLYNAENYRQHHANKLQNNGDLPDIFDLDLLKIHNFVIHSSVIYTKELWEKVGKYPNNSVGEDYQLLLKMLALTNMVYIKIPCFIYDS